MQVYGFHLWFMFGFDFSEFVQAESQEELQKLRAEDDFFLKLWENLCKSKISLGEFSVTNRDYRDDLLASIKETIAKGGKNQFAPVFINEYAPLQYSFSSSALKKFPKPGESITASDISVIRGKTYKGNRKIIRSDDVILSLFRNGILSISIKISNHDDIDFSGIDFITILKDLSSTCELFFKKAVLSISKSLIESKEVNALLPGLTFKEVDLAASNTDICHGRSYKFLILDPNNTEVNEFNIDKIETDDKQEILGMLNIAHWYKEYNKSYTNNVFNTALSYKTNEVFICDNNATLIILPDYWNNEELRTLINNLKLLTELINSQLVFTFKLNGIIESFLIKNGASKDEDGNLFAVQIKKLLLVLEKTSDVSAHIIHGFTEKFVDKLAGGVSLSKRSEMVYTKMKLLDELVTLRAQSKIYTRQLKISLITVSVAFISTIIALFSLILSSSK